MKKAVLLIFLALLTPKNTLAQYHLQNNEELNSFKSIPKEKVFVHYNDNLLLTGEYLYYKFYCRNSENQTPSEVSKIGYVELIGKGDKLIFRHKISLTDGLGQGDFFIPVAINTGRYKLVGYTQWMRNEGTQSFFVDDVVIINPYKKLSKGTSLNSKDTLKLVQKDRINKPIDTTISNISKKRNSFLEIELPQRIFGKRKLVRLQIKESIQSDLNGHYSISVRKTNDVDLLPRLKTINFTSDLALPQKINQIDPKTEYSNKNATRIISGHIISTIDSLPISGQTISLYTSKDDNKVRISRSDNNGFFRFELNKWEVNNEIMLELLESEKAGAKIVLDSSVPLNLKPKKLDTIRDNNEIYLPEMRGELVTGHIISKTSKLPVANESIGLSITGNNGLIKISRSNEKGAFYFNLDNGNRNNQVIFDVLGKNNEEIKIALDSTTINLSSFDFKEIYISQDLNPIFEQRSIYNQIENAFFEQKADSTITTTYNLPAYKDFQEVYILDDYTRFPSLRETIVEIIEDVLVKKRKGQFVLQVRRDGEFFIDSDDAPLILADNVLIQNATNLFDYDVKKIQQIGISRNDFYIGPKKYQGIFSVETKDGDYLSQVNSKRSSIQIIPGPISTKKYYTQDYSQSLSKSTKHNADFRQQLLWLPNVIIDKLAIFEFYTSDNTGTYEISIEGFTKNGKPVSLIEEIYVE